MAATTGSHPRPKLAAGRIATAGAMKSTAPKPLVSFGMAQTTSSSGLSVLMLADTDVVSTTALATSLADAGLQVTLRPAPEYTWDGSNPALSGFDVVVHLNGSTYDFPLPSSAQDTLTSFVQNGGGFVGAKWNGYEVQPGLANLVLQGVGFDPAGPEQNCGACPITYQTVPAGEGHPVLAGLPASFTFTADGHDAGPQASFDSDPSVVLMQVSAGGPAVLVRQFGTGRVVNFSFAPNYQWDDLGNVHDPVTLQDPNIQQLYLNAVLWAAGSGSGSAQPQSITFGPLADKVFGDQAFTISASASSDLPVSFTAAGECTVLGTTVSITAAGSCTITAHQAGNDNYLPADDVSQSFAIAKAPASITILGTVTTFDGTTKSVLALTDPAGLSGISVTYSQGGVSVLSPRNAGDYQVTATLDNPNYAASPISTILTISPAVPVISWTPAELTSGTPLGSAQLNATARGVGGVALTGSYVYNPPAGSLLPAGTASLSVQFTPTDANYTVASKTVSLTVVGSMTFYGFYPPVRNMPARNTAKAGSVIPVKFSVGGGARGVKVVRSGSPASLPMACENGIPEGAIDPSQTLGAEGLRESGSSYTYGWKTDPSWAGSCRKFVLTLTDGSKHEALFRFVGKPVRRGIVQR